MRSKQVCAEVELGKGERKIKVRALVDTGVSRSVISKKTCR